MTNPKIDHKIRKPTATDHSGARRTSAPASERETSASTAMIEACDRLGQKLDEVTGVVREQIEAWRQFRPTAGPVAQGTHQSAPSPEPDRTPARTEIPPGPSDGATSLTIPPDGNAATAPAKTPEADGITATAEGAMRLVDTLSRSGNGWQEQAAGVQRALEAVMAYLENQAATAAPKVDVDGMLSRLRDLEERQQNLQSQFNTSRWGP